MLPSEINEADTTVIPEDFTAGDRVWMETSPGHVFFGTILESTSEKMDIRMDFNKEVTITDRSPVPLEDFIKTMGKVIDVQKLETGAILSRINRVDGKRVREYAEVVEMIPFQKISLKFFDGLDDHPINYYGGRTSLEEQLRRWEVEA